MNASQHPATRNLTPGFVHNWQQRPGESKSDAGFRYEKEFAAAGGVRIPVPYGAPGFGSPGRSQPADMETVRIPQNGGAVVITRPKQKPEDNPLAGLGNVQGALGSSTPGANALSYRSGINVGGGVGNRGILAGLTETGTQADPNVAAFTKAAAWNDQSQIGRAIESRNQQIQMDQQARRSESTTQGASNLASIYGDHAERGNSQIGLAASIMANNIGFAAGLYNRGRGR